VNEDYLSFEKVLRELQIEEQELKRLVSAGEIKAFRDSDEMRFNREEVEKLKTDKDSGPDVIELLDSDAEGEEETAPTMDSSSDVIAEELDFDDDSSDVGMTTAQISDDDFLSEDIGGAEDEELDLGPIDLDEDDLGDEVSAPSRERKIVKKSKVAAMAEEVEAVEPQWALGLLIVSTICLVLCVLVMLDIATSTPSPVVEWLVSIFEQ